jgi:hypothetical protein
MRTCALTVLVTVLIASLVGAADASDGQAKAGLRIAVVVSGGEGTGATSKALARLKDLGFARVSVVPEGGAKRDPVADLVVILSVNKSRLPPNAKDDSYTVTTVSTTPLTVAAAGANERGMLYAAYRLADLLTAKADLSKLDLLVQPKVQKRFVSFGATTHGRQQYRPELYWKTLNELPRFGYSGVVIYPGGGTPIGRNASPVVEAAEGALSLDPQNTAQWKQWLDRVDAYGLEIMMTIPPVTPPGYDEQAIEDFYSGGDEPGSYLADLKSHFRQYLELLTQAYPQVDAYMFNSTEGATFGRSKRFFGPAPRRSSHADYLRNNERIMGAYFDVLSDFFRGDIDKVCFWTHSFGTTSEGMRKMREVLFRHPAIIIIEDDFWNNNLWPHDLPAMAYLPEDLRAQVSQRNPFALFQIATDGEYYGGGSLPNAYPDSHVRSANEALERKARMVIQRLDLHDRTPYGTAFGTMEIVPFAASKQLWDPTPPLPEIWNEWAERRFGKEAAPLVIAALRESHTVLVKGLSCNGIDLLGVGSEFNPRLWKRSPDGLTRFHLFSKPGKRLLEKTEHDVILSPEYTAYQMNTHTIAIDEFERNQDEAMRAVQRGLGQIEQARRHLAPADYEMLKDIFENGVNVLTATRLLGRTAYAANIALSNFDGVGDPKALFEQSVRDLEGFLEQEKLIEPMTRNLKQVLESYEALGRRAGEATND